MTPEQFCYWLQGFAELNGRVPNEQEWKAIREHLSTVFYKITPPVQPYYPEKYPPLMSQPDWAPPIPIIC